MKQNTALFFALWGGITLLFVLFAVLGYLFFSSRPRFEKRKKEIALGMATCVFAVSSATFAPVLFSFVNILPLQNGLITFVLFGLPAIFSLALVVCVCLIILKIREEKKEEKTEYKRKHIFEYKADVLTQSNKK